MEQLIKEQTQKLLANQIQEARRQRQIQVRQQAIAWTEATRKKFEESKQRQISELADVISTQVQEAALKNIEHLTMLNDLEMAEIGMAHRAAAGFKNVERLKSLKRLKNDEIAKNRGSTAMLRHVKEKEAEKSKSMNIIKRKEDVRKAEDKLSKDLIRRKPLTVSNYDAQSKTKLGPLKYHQSIANTLKVASNSAGDNQQIKPSSKPNLSKSKGKRIEFKLSEQQQHLPTAVSSEHTADKKKRPIKSKESALAEMIRIKCGTTDDGAPEQKEYTGLLRNKYMEAIRGTPQPTQRPIESTVRYFDATIPKKEVMYIAPEGLAIKESRNSPDAWEKGKISSEKLLQQRQTEVLKQEEITQKAEERGKIALKKAKLEKELSEVKNQLLGEIEFVQLGSGSQKAILGLDDGEEVADTETNQNQDDNQSSDEFLGVESDEEFIFPTSPHPTLKSFDVLHDNTESNDIILRQRLLNASPISNIEDSSSTDSFASYTPPSIYSIADDDEDDKRITPHEKLEAPVEFQLQRNQDMPLNENKQEFDEKRVSSKTDIISSIPSTAAGEENDIKETKTKDEKLNTPIQFQSKRNQQRVSLIGDKELAFDKKGVSSKTLKNAPNMHSDADRSKTNNIKMKTKHEKPRKHLEFYSEQNPQNTSVHEYDNRSVNKGIPTSVPGQKESALPPEIASSERQSDGSPFFLEAKTASMPDSAPISQKISKKQFNEGKSEIEKADSKPKVKKLDPLTSKGPEQVMDSSTNSKHSLSSEGDTSPPSRSVSNRSLKDKILYEEEKMKHKNVTERGNVIDSAVDDSSSHKICKKTEKLGRSTLLDMVDAILPNQDEKKSFSKDGIKSKRTSDNLSSSKTSTSSRTTSSSSSTIAEINVRTTASAKAIQLDRKLSSLQDLHSKAHEQEKLLSSTSFSDIRNESKSSNNDTGSSMETSDSIRQSKTRLDKLGDTRPSRKKSQLKVSSISNSDQSSSVLVNLKIKEMTDSSQSQSSRSRISDHYSKNSEESSDILRLKIMENSSSTPSRQENSSSSTTDYYSPPDGPFTSTPDGKLHPKSSRDSEEIPRRISVKSRLLYHYLERFLERKPGSIENLPVSSSSSSIIRVDSDAVSSDSLLASVNETEQEDSIPSDMTGHTSSISNSNNGSSKGKSALHSDITEDDSGSTIATTAIVTGKIIRRNTAPRARLSSAKISTTQKSSSDNGEVTSSDSLTGLLKVLSTHQEIEKKELEFDNITPDNSVHEHSPPATTTSNNTSRSNHRSNAVLDSSGGSIPDVSAILRGLRNRAKQGRQASSGSSSGSSPKSGPEKEAKRVEQLDDMTPIKFWETPPHVNQRGSNDTEKMATVFENLIDKWNNLRLEKPPWTIYSNDSPEGS